MRFQQFAQENSAWLTDWALFSVLRRRFDLKSWIDWPEEFAFRHPDVIPVAASVGGAFDFHDLYGQGLPLDEMYESRERCRLDTAVLHIDPHRFPPHIWFACDPEDADWYRGNDRLHEKLAAYGCRTPSTATPRPAGTRGRTSTGWPGRCWHSSPRGWRGRAGV